MASMYPSRMVNVSIDHPPEQVYDYIYDLRHFPTWATSFCQSMEVQGELGQMMTPEGPAQIRFTARNHLGVLDHWVKPQGGEEIHVPMRVVPNGAGSEVIFTLYQLPGVSDEAFSRDAGQVLQDLQSLKRVLEKSEE